VFDAPRRGLPRWFGLVILAAALAGIAVGYWVFSSLT
jgi:hypothetical protein